MDLDKYKKAWDNQPEETNKVSKVDIYKMAHSKSSSIVKWIFIIGMLEIVVPLLLVFLTDPGMEKSREAYEELGVSNYFIYSQIIVYPIVIYFLIQFYLNYKNISTIESTKILMQKILKTRKTVKHYVLFNLSYLFITIVYVSVATTMNKLDDFTMGKIIIIALITLVFSAIAMGLFWLFYQLLYGILLRKLNKNYKDLAKLDELN